MRQKKLNEVSLNNKLPKAKKSYYINNQVQYVLGDFKKSIFTPQILPFINLSTSKINFYNASQHIWQRSQERYKFTSEEIK